MKRCVIEVAPAPLRDLLGLPDGAVIDGLGYSDRLGVIELRVVGFGAEVAEGALLPRARTILRHQKINGEFWFQAVAEVQP